MVWPHLSFSTLSAISSSSLILLSSSLLHFFLIAKFFHDPNITLDITPLTSTFILALAERVSWSIAWVLSARWSFRAWVTSYHK